jgi:CRISPR-associated protein Cas1
MQRARCDFLEHVWSKDRDLQDAGFYADDDEVELAMYEHIKAQSLQDKIPKADVPGGAAS